MMRKLSTLVWLACATLLLALAGALVTIDGANASSTNLLKDGDFSEPSSPGGFTTFEKGSFGINGWLITKGTVDLIGTHWSAPGGLRSVDLDGTPGIGAIAQAFATVAGDKYTVSFLLAANNECPPPIKHLRVSAAGVFADFTVNGDTTGVRSATWPRKSWTFNAVEHQSTLQFESKDPAGGECGPVIADVRVTAS